MERNSLVLPAILSKGILERTSRKSLPLYMYLLAIRFGLYISSPDLTEINVVLKLIKISQKKVKSTKDSNKVTPTESREVPVKAMPRGIVMEL